MSRDEVMEAASSYLHSLQIKELCRFRHISQKELARRAGINEQHLSRLLARRPGPLLSELEGDTLERLAKALSVPLVCLITTPNDPRWLPIDFTQPGKVDAVMGELAEAKAILTLGNALDCHILPDAMSLTFAEAEARGWGLPEPRIATEMELMREYQVHRRVARQERTYLLQVIGPESVLRWAQATNPAWLAGIAQEMGQEYSKRQTIVGVLPDEAWARLVEQITPWLPSPDWIKVNIADSVLAVVWHRGGAHYTYDPDIVADLRGCAEGNAVAGVAYSFVRQDAGKRRVRQVYGDMVAYFHLHYLERGRKSLR